MSQIRQVKKVATFVVPEVWAKLGQMAEEKSVSLYRLAADILEDATLKVKLVAKSPTKKFKKSKKKVPAVR